MKHYDFYGWRDALSYGNDEEQFRAGHFARVEKRERYEYLRRHTLLHVRGGGE